MSDQRKTPRGSERSATNGKSPETKKSKPADKKEAPQKTVAAGMAGTALREETASPEAAPAAPAKPAPQPGRPVRAKPEQGKPAPAATPATKPAPVAAKPTPAAAKPAPTAAKPAPAAVKPAPSAAKPASPTAKTAAKQPAAPSPATAQHLLGQTVDTLEQSLKAAGRSTLAVNCKLLDFARTNLNSSLDHAKDLAAARSPVRIMRLQMEFWQDCLETFASQAQELRTLSAELVANANEPLRRNLFNPPRAA